jgi:cellulose synthase/poly-beta-1,6-N-acetylglucosamine synthase-like glycosyltransferase
VVIPTHRRPDRCRRLLEALARQSLPASEFEVIVVDDASGDETGAVLAAMAKEVPYRLRTMTMAVNSGPAPARNAGWSLALTPLVAFVDDDCVPAPDWLEAGLRAFEAGEAVGVVQGPTVPPGDYDGAKWPRWHHCQDIRSPSPFFEACNVFYRRVALADVGGFDEAIGWWGEDTALGWGVLGRGWKKAWSDDAVVTHDVTVRGWRWRFQMALYERHMVELAARYPQFRAEAFWRPWAFQRRNALFALAVIGAALSLRWRPAGALVLPYLWKTRQSPGDALMLIHWAEVIGVDAASTVGHLGGSLKARIVVL